MGRATIPTVNVNQLLPIPNGLAEFFVEYGSLRLNYPDSTLSSFVSNLDSVEHGLITM